ncbi:hypothetical protein ABFX02_06G048000 [Erythranthe guttata]
MLTDERRREIHYALEYAMLALQNQLPPPMPQPPTWSELEEKCRDIQQGFVRPIPVPRGWKPCLEVAQKMVDRISEPGGNLQLRNDILDLKDLVNEKETPESFNGYLSAAHGFLLKAHTHLAMADTARMEADMQRWKHQDK